jgi:hypothetical protein
MNVRNRLTRRIQQLEQLYSELAMVRDQSLCGYSSRRKAEIRDMLAAMERCDQNPALRGHVSNPDTLSRARSLAEGYVGSESGAWPGILSAIVARFHDPTPLPHE